MDSDTENLILIEVRELRSAFNENSQVTGERLASLETSMYSLTGNGQPGRISKLEDDVSTLQKWRWRALGAFSCLGFLGSCVGWIIMHVLPLLPPF